MKNIAYILIIFLFGTSLVAQPTLTEAAILPIGTSLPADFHKGPLSIDNNGPNQTWHLPENPTSESIETNLTILDPADAPFSDLFPNATLTILNEDLYTYSHYTIEDNQLISYGFDLGDDSFGGLTYTTFEQGETVLQWPLNYEDVINNETMYEQYILGMKLGMGVRESTSTVTGYGTLITGNGTYENVLKMEVSVSFTGEDVDQIHFFHPSSMIPLASVTYLSENFYEYIYLDLDGLSTSTSDIEVESKITASYINGSIQVLDPSNTEIKEIHFSDGNTFIQVPEVETFENRHILHFNQPLLTGIYYITLQYKNGKETVKIFVP